MAKKKKKTKTQNTGIGGGQNSIGFPGNQGAPFSESVADVDTSFKNLRWYLISNDRQLLNELYVELGLVQTIVDVPVDDALRGGVEIKSNELDEDQIQKLTASLDRDGDITSAGQAAKWNRLFGGAGIIIMTDQDPEEELDLNAIGPDTPLEFRAADMWELTWDFQNSQGYNPIDEVDETDFYSYYGKPVHKSRVMILKGLTAPSFIRPRLRGWGFSVAEALIRSLNQYLRATSLAFEVLNEFKIDVYKIKNLVNTLLAPNAAEQIHRRVAQTNYTKSYQNAIVMDGEDDYAQKQLSFAGLADAMAQIRMQVASDMRMPLTKLFGISAAGFNSGEDDIEVYNAMVESTVRNKIKYDILKICEIKCQKLFGFVPDDLEISFKSLRVLSSEQEEAVRTQKFNRLYQALMAGKITDQEFRDACNKGGLFDVKLEDVGDDQTGYLDDTVQKPSDNPGANRPDKESPYANSERFDRASYEADGGDGWIDDRRKYFFEDPQDKGLWARVKEEGRSLFSGDNWKFNVWLYQKQGGQFHNDDSVSIPVSVTGDV